MKLVLLNLSIAALLLLVCEPSAAWVMLSSKTTPTHNIRLQAASDTTSPEDMRKDIQEMKRQALERLDKLSHQVEELQEQQAALEAHEKTAVVNIAPSFEPPPQAMERATAPQAEKKKTADTKANTPPPKEETVIVSSPVSTDLLDDTVWKIALDIRREQGTWMPAEWGKSGDRLRCQLVIEFTSQECSSHNEDDFFGVVGSSPAKILRVQEAWIFPHGVGSHSVGRKPLPVQANGVYKVVLGQGPYGTHVVRFYFSVKENVRPDPDSDIYLPAGRVYGTVGYFPQSKDHHHSSSAKDAAQAEYHAAVMKEAELQLEDQSDERLFSIDQVQRLKELWATKRQIKKLGEKVKEARQKDPDRSQLRYSRSGDVGLSREGGVCCKVYQGMAMEYRILGRMEVANDEHHHHPPQHHDEDDTPTYSHQIKKTTEDSPTSLQP